MRCNSRLASASVLVRSSIQPRHIASAADSGAWAATLHVFDLGLDLLRRIAVHDVGIAATGDEILGGFGLTTGMIVGRGRVIGFGLQGRVLQLIVVSRIVHAIALPERIDNFQPFASTRIAIVVFIKSDTVLQRFVLPTTRYNIQRQPTATDVIDIGCLLGQQCRRVKMLDEPRPSTPDAQ